MLQSLRWEPSAGRSAACTRGPAATNQLSRQSAAGLEEMRTQQQSEEGAALVWAQRGRGRSITAPGTQRSAYKDAQCKMCPRFCFVSSWVTSCTETFWLPGGSNNRGGWISTRESGLGDAYSQVGVAHIMSGLHGGCFCSNELWLPLQHIVTLLRALQVMKRVSSWTGRRQRNGGSPGSAGTSRKSGTRTPVVQRHSVLMHFVTLQTWTSLESFWKWPTQSST